MFVNTSTKNYKMLHISKFIAVALFIMTPILAGITSGLMINNSLFWVWIIFGLGCLGWFVGATIVTNRMKSAAITPLVQPATQQI